VHYQPDLDESTWDQASAVAASEINNSTANSYRVYRELHSPEHVYADTYLIFGKVMELGVKDLYFKGEML
jgi:hypothetical protein